MLTFLELLLVCVYYIVSCAMHQCGIVLRYVVTNALKILSTDMVQFYLFIYYCFFFFLILLCHKISGKNQKLNFVEVFVSIL